MCGARVVNRHSQTEWMEADMLHGNGYSRECWLYVLVALRWPASAKAALRMQHLYLAAAAAAPVQVHQQHPAAKKDTVGQ